MILSIFNNKKKKYFFADKNVHTASNGVWLKGGGYPFPPPPHSHIGDDPFWIALGSEACRGGGGVGTGNGFGRE